MSVSQFGPTCTFPSASTRLATFFSSPASGIPRAYDRLIAVLELLAVKIASDGVKTLVEEIREFAGTLARERVAMSDGVFVTLSGFTDAAELRETSSVSRSLTAATSTRRSSAYATRSRALSATLRWFSTTRCTVGGFDACPAVVAASGTW